MEDPVRYLLGPKKLPLTRIWMMDDLCQCVGGTERNVCAGRYNRYTTATMEDAAHQLLAIWLRSVDEHAALQARDKLIAEHVQPVIRRIVSLRIGRSSSEFEDVCQNALASVIQKLGQLRREAAANGEIRDIANYAAVVAFRAADEHVRRQGPSWNRIAGRLRYLISKASDLEMWLTDGRDVLGYANLRGSAPDPVGVDNPAAQKAVSQHSSTDIEFADAVRALLKASNGAVVFSVAVSILAQHFDTQLRTRVQSSDEDNERAWEKLADRSPEIDSQADQAKLLRHIWTEIGALPLDQRRALLLNLEGIDGGDIRLFEWLGVTSIREIAAALEIPAQEFAALWNSLPLNDLQIAARFGMNRQRVINLRSSARKRLLNRMGSAGEAI